MTHRNGHTFSTGLCLGAALGAIAALLLAPRSGRDLRSEISRGAGRLKDRAQAELLLREALKAAPADSPVARLCKQDLELIAAGHGRLARWRHRHRCRRYET